MARILLADDDPTQLALRKMILEASGYQVSTAPNAAEAIRALSAEQPEVLVTDLRLPALEDGLELIRSTAGVPRPPKVIAVCGCPADLGGQSEARLVARVIPKPSRTEVLLRAIRELTAALCLLLLFGARGFAESFRFELARPAEVVAELEMSAPGADWGEPGREAALAELSMPGRPGHHIMLYAGEHRHTYAAFLGRLPSGAHELRVEREGRYSAAGAALRVFGARFREVGEADPDAAALAHAPVLLARPDTLGRFTDVPLLSYCERLSDDGRPLLQYTVIFSNEDGGTSTRALMARWGRTTDIEYIYRAWLTPDGRLARATIQAKDHKEIEFRGSRDGTHPLLIPSTLNNMVAPGRDGPVRYQIPPMVVDLARHSREWVMDEHPVTYRVMAQELRREGKLRAFAAVDGEKISDPRNYLYLEARADNRQGALAARVRLRGEDVWRSSDLGRADYAISRSGWFRTTVELPPGTRAADIAEVGFACLVAPAKPQPAAGTCVLQEISRAFLLDGEYRPGPSLLGAAPGLEIPSGLMRSFAPDQAR